MQELVKINFEGMELSVRPDKNHEWLMETSLVAAGYGVSDTSLRSTKSRNADEIKEGKHYLVLQNATSGQNRNQVFWTKRGALRLGFFIKSERARKFRDMLEDLIIKQMEQPWNNHVIPQTHAEALRAYANEVDQNQQLTQQLQVAERAAANNEVYRDYVFERILPSKDTYCATQIGKELGMSAKALNQTLHEMGIQYKVRDMWVLYSPYDQKGYHKVVTEPYELGGEKRTRSHMEWTEKGRGFIRQLFNKRDNAVIPAPQQFPAPVLKGAISPRKERQYRAKSELLNLVELLHSNGFPYKFIADRVIAYDPESGIDYWAFTRARLGQSIVNDPDILRVLKLAMASEIEMIMRK